jgi:predicted phosphodiesterase
MESKESEQGKYISGLVRKFPDTPTMTLAKKAYKERPEYFADVEAARYLIRRRRGAAGDSRRKEAIVPIVERPRNPFDSIPKSHKVDRKPFEIKATSILGLFDVHIPYHDVDCLKLALQYGVDNKVDCILIGGDLLDCHQLSDFVKDARKRKFSEELQDVRMFFSVLRETFPQAKIYYKIGNHEERYWRFMAVKAPELLDVDAFSFEALTHCDKYGVVTISGRTKINVGKLSIFHGHEFGKSTFSPVNVARGLYMRAKASAVCGHSHQTSEHTERDVNDKMVTTWSVGCLCELSPDYAPYNKWNHGFIHITTSGTDFNVRNFRIHKGKIL